MTADLLQRSRAATNMTDQIAALACLADSESAPLPCDISFETLDDALACMLLMAISVQHRAVHCDKSDTLRPMP